MSNWNMGTLNPEPDPQQIIILQGMEVTWVKRRPIKDIYTWIQRFALYMAKHDPSSIPEMLAYMLTIMKAQKEFKASPMKKPAIAGENSQHCEWDPPRPHSSGPVCWQYNQGHCSFQPNCHFRHVCSACKHLHPLLYCPRASRGGPQSMASTAQKGEKAKDTRANI